MSEEHPTIGDAPDPLIGTVLAERYRIESRLGEGGMGAVYLARHVILEKVVALKILHDEYARRRELVERFLHEAKAASRIRHEHVIDITDFGETASKNVFFAMEYLDGHDIAVELNTNHVLAWPRAKKIILQICAGLQAAHEAGVIHRDLKPENIYLIERFGRPDFVKVLDFGVAKLVETEDQGRRLTKTGMVFGTPEYMSPEQARGEKPDIRVDVYAVGCILFELITGDVPYHADNFMGVLTKHLLEPIPKLSERTHRTDFPPGLAAVIEQAIAKDRNDRFASMNELAVAIDALDDIEGIGYHANDSGERRKPAPAAPVAAEAAPTPVSPTKSKPSPSSLVAPAPAPDPVVPVSATSPTIRAASAQAFTDEATPLPPPAVDLTEEHDVITDLVEKLPEEDLAPRKRNKALWLAGAIVLAGAATAVVLTQMGGPTGTAAPAASTPQVTSPARPKPEPPKPEPPKAAVTSAERPAPPPPAAAMSSPPAAATPPATPAVTPAVAQPTPAAVTPTVSAAPPAQLPASVAKQPKAPPVAQTKRPPPRTDPRPHRPVTVAKQPPVTPITSTPAPAVVPVPIAAPVQPPAPPVTAPAIDATSSKSPKADLKDPFKTPPKK